MLVKLKWTSIKYDSLLFQIVAHEDISRCSAHTYLTDDDKAISQLSLDGLAPFAGRLCETVNHFVSLFDRFCRLLLPSYD